MYWLESLWKKFKTSLFDWNTLLLFYLFIVSDVEKVIGYRKKACLVTDLWYTFGYVILLQDSFEPTLVWVGCIEIAQLRQLLQWNWNLGGEWLMSCVGLWCCNLDNLVSSLHLQCFLCFAVHQILGLYINIHIHPLNLFNFCANSSFSHHDFKFFCCFLVFSVFCSCFYSCILTLAFWFL